MVDTTVADQQTEVSPVNVGVTEERSPAPASAQAETTELDSLLAEWDASIKPEPEPVADNIVQNAQPDQTIADLLSATVDKQRIDELTGQVDSLRAEQHRAEELKAFNEYSDNLQKQLPHWLPEDYAVTKLKALAHDPEIALAWDMRNVDKAAANLELQKVQVALYRLQQDPNADPAKVAQLNQYGYRLQVALNSSAILRKATLGILNEASKLPLPLDIEATNLKQEIAFHMKSGAGKRVAEPPPNLGAMTDNELRQYTKQWGF